MAGPTAAFDRGDILSQPTDGSLAGPIGDSASPWRDASRRGFVTRTVDELLHRIAQPASPRDLYADRKARQEDPAKHFSRTT